MSFKLHQALSRKPIRGFLLKELFKGEVNVARPTTTKLSVKSALPVPHLELCWSLAALNINNTIQIQTPPHLEPPKERIPPPLPVSQKIKLPQVEKSITYEDQLPTKTIEDPNPSPTSEKQAARLIVIRRNKMKKHKLRKLRKRMKYEWAKIRLRREVKKEKLFQQSLYKEIKLAQSFDPAKYAAEKIAKAKEVELPQVWYGVKYPEFIIKQLMEEQEMKKKEKEADEKRRASMSPYVRDYLKNLPE